MSEPPKNTPEKSVQDFLQRWSRRKLGIADADDGAEAPAPMQPPRTGEAEPAQPVAEAEVSPESAAAAFDLAKLPPIESIDAATDIRPFLAPGVPVELTRAALRRAWTSDPVIRDFVGIAENQWDFTKPETVPGFGSLEFTDEIRGMVARLFGETPPEAPQNSLATSDLAASDQTQPTKFNAPESGVPHAAPAAAARPDVPPPASGDARAEHAAPQNESCTNEPDPGRPKHGGALPK